MVGVTWFAVASLLCGLAPTIELLIDQSGSMNEPYGNGLSRWQAMKPTRRLGEIDFDRLPT